MSDYYEIWCDGACEGNGKPGGVAGYGVIILHDGTELPLRGVAAGVGTNNVGELLAAAVALENTPEKSVVTITTDSEYVKKGITEWIVGWKRNGWRTKGRKDVKNRGLWGRLDALNQKRFVEWKWVRGHTGVPENERADILAVSAIRAHKIAACPQQKQATTDTPPCTPP